MASVTLPVLASGCTSTEGEFPTLAKRNVETYYEQKSESDGDNPQPVLPASPALVGQLDDLLASAKAGQNDFDGALPLARSRANAARGAAVGGESWSQATTAISALNASRSESSTALADLDQLYAETLTGDALNVSDANAIRTVHEIIFAMVAAQTRTVDELTQMVGG